VIEVRNLSELDEALSNGAERLLLDNMSVENVRAALVKIKEQPRTIPVEVSGGIQLENVRAYAETGVDYISVGALTHSPPAVDLSMRIVPA
jgi:nicotinate-nucleotide pyrophosphorylase (carboxylating)